MTSTFLRALRWQDLSEVHRIETDSFARDVWSLAGFWAELAARPRRDYVVLEDSARPPGWQTQGAEPAGDRTLIGYGGLDLAGETADVMTIAIDPARRGQGHGVVLLEHLLQRAQQSGARQVMLEVRADNEAAIGLYARYGFQEVRRRRGYYQLGAIDALIMRKEVVARG